MFAGHTRESSAFDGDPRKKEVASKFFKKATTITGKVWSPLNEWHVLAPFPVGRTELDADPVEAYGGIEALARRR